MRILQFTNKRDYERLTKVLPKVTKDSEYKKINKVWKKMVDICQKNGGIGISANQVGIQLRFFIIDTKTFKKVCINPAILSGKGRYSSEEGCLSFADGTKKFRKRYSTIDVTYEDCMLIKHKTTLKGIDAIVFQHEIDHMNGQVI